jgi:multidrug efflux pump subunit AcrA (membrane-fusion protein)
MPVHVLFTLVDVYSQDGTSLKVKNLCVKGNLQVKQGLAIFVLSDIVSYL